MRRRAWTYEEDEYLKSSCKSMNLNDLAASMNRSRKSIDGRMRTLGLYANRLWSKEEELFLAENYSLLGAKGVADHLNKEISSVYHKARRMNLRSERMWNKDEDDVLTKMHNEGYEYAEIAKAVGRTLSATRSRALNIGIAKKFQYLPDIYCIDCGKKLGNRYLNALRCRKCAAKAMSGENNHFWNGGVSSLYKLIQHRLWSPWKFPILKRDNFICQQCGHHGRDLEVHHIRRLVDIRDMVIAANPELSLDIYEDRVALAEMIVASHTLQDGITLCKKCHRQIHTSKSGELLETPNATGEGNQQLSRSNVLSFVGRKVQRLPGEDAQSNNPGTSARHALAGSVMI